MKMNNYTCRDRIPKEKLYFGVRWKNVNVIVYIQLVKKERTHNISIHNQWDKVLLWTVMKLFAAAEYGGVDCLARGRKNVDIECIMDEL